MLFKLGTGIKDRLLQKCTAVHNFRTVGLRGSKVTKKLPEKKLNTLTNTCVWEFQKYMNENIRLGSVRENGQNVTQNYKNWSVLVQF